MKRSALLPGAAPARLGKCCVCEREDPTVRNILALHFVAPAGRGWGCMICGLPLNGAIAVVCDDCLPTIQAGANPKFVCVGYPSANERVPFSSLTEPFDHDMSKH
jgi:hypothetical protein